MSAWLDRARRLALELHLLLDEVVRWRSVHVNQRHSVNSVAFVVRGVAFTQKDMSEVTAALVAMDLVRIRLDVLRTDVALIAGPEAIVPRRPTVIGKLRVHAVQRELAPTTSEMSGLRVRVDELVRARRFCPILTEASVRHRR